MSKYGNTAQLDFIKEYSPKNKSEYYQEWVLCPKN